MVKELEKNFGGFEGHTRWKIFEFINFYFLET